MKSLAGKNLTKAFSSWHTPVSGLLFAGSPTAIGAAVGPAVVDALKGMGRTWPCSHVREKVFYRAAPPVANRYSSSTVVVECAVGGIVASGEHVYPCVVFGTPRPSVGPGSVPYSVSDATATDGFSTPDFRAGNAACPTARAEAFEKCPLSSPFQKGFDCQFTERLANKFRRFEACPSHTGTRREQGQLVKALASPIQ